IDHRGVAHADAQLRHRIPPRSPDVDPEVGDLRHLLPLLRLHEVDGLLSDDSSHLTVAPEDAQALANQDLRVPPPDAIDIEEPIAVDMSDDEPDLVDVPGEHDPGSSLRSQHGDGIPVDVRLDTVGDAFRLGAPDACCGKFESG